MKPILLYSNVETVFLPDKTSCHPITISLPDEAIVTSIDFEEDSGKRKLLFRYLRNGSRATETCRFYLISKQQPKDNCLRIECADNEQIKPIALFHCPHYSLIGRFNKPTGVMHRLSTSGL